MTGKMKTCRKYILVTVSERQLCHDELHARVSRSRITFSTWDVVNPQNCSGDDENDECEERNPTEAIQRVPIPDDAQFVLLSMCEWHLSMHTVVSISGHRPIILNTEAGIEPREHPQEGFLYQAKFSS